MTTRRYPSWQRRHQAVLHWLLENPARTQKDCAAALGYSESHVSRIVNSPDFQWRYRELMQIGDQEVMRRVIERLGG